MTGTTSFVVGRAIFGTDRGLVYQGTGVLAGSPVSIFEFEIGRQRDGLLHRQASDFALFFRRLEDVSSGHELNLFGMVGPCRDANGRRGFFGTCLAMPLDGIRANPHFTDWSKLIGTLSELWNEASRLKDPKTEYFQNRRVLESSDHDQSISWRTADGGTLVLQADEEIGDGETLQSVQALAYKYGSQYTTILAFSDAIEGSIAITGREATDALAEYRAARAIAENTSHTETDVTAGRDARYEECEVGSLEQAWRAIYRLQDQIDDLHIELNKSVSRSTHGKSDKLASSTFGGELPLTYEGTSRFPFWAVISVAAGVLAVILLIVVWSIFTKENDSIPDPQTAPITGAGEDVN